MSTDGNDLAFPIDMGPTIHAGMTKREYMAAALLQGMVSDPENYSVDWESLAVCAVTAADKLICALNADTP